jgi:hypothetical protein
MDKFAAIESSQLNSNLRYGTGRGAPTAEVAVTDIQTRAHRLGSTIGPGELCVTLWLEIPGLQRREVIIARANLRLPIERDLLAVAESIDDR